MRRWCFLHVFRLGQGKAAEFTHRSHLQELVQLNRKDIRRREDATPHCAREIRSDESIKKGIYFEGGKKACTHFTKKEEKKTVNLLKLFPLRYFLDSGEPISVSANKEIYIIKNLTGEKRKHVGAKEESKPLKVFSFFFFCCCSFFLHDARLLVGASEELTRRSNHERKKSKETQRWKKVEGKAKNGRL